MVYWGCGTPKNRLIWGLFTFSALAGSLLIIAGATKLDICSKLPPQLRIAGACSAAPTAVTVVGVFVLLATIPCVLFFSGCARGPPQVKYPTEGIPSSAVTVVRQTATGPQVFQYDSKGKLLAAPDCTKHTKHSQQYVLPVKTPATLAPIKTKKAPPTPGVDSSQNSPRHSVKVRTYSTDSPAETPTAEVHVSLVGPLAAGRAAQLQQQLAQLVAQQQQQQMEQQQQQQSDEGQHGQATDQEEQRH